MRRVLSMRWPRLCVLLVAALPVLWPGAAAAGVLVRAAETFLADGVYHLNADIDYEFSAAALEALQNGVPLVVALEIEISRERDYLWNENVASLRQRYQLAYDALTDRYVLTNLNSGADTYYPTRAAAIAALGTVERLPLLDAALLDGSQRYRVALYVGLDRDALPVPMRVMSYFSDDWDLGGEWYVWPLR